MEEQIQIVENGTNKVVCTSCIYPHYFTALQAPIFCTNCGRKFIYDIPELDGRAVINIADID